MRIIIDLQGMQSESRFRGIGRYTTSLAHAILEQNTQHEIFFVANASFPESLLQIRESFRGLIPNENIVAFKVPQQIAENHPYNANRTRAAEYIREQFIHALAPDVLLITSLFEGYVDDTVTSVGALAHTIPTAVILYDLIPAMNPEMYLTTPLQRNYYERKLASLKKADQLLSISEYSRQCAIDHLQIPADKITTISTAIEPIFAPRKVSAEEAQQLRQYYQIQRKIILCVPGGFDGRKNVDSLIKAFYLLPPKIRKQYQLVIASRITAKDRLHIETLTKQTGLELDEVILTDYMSNTDLVTLYNLTDLLVFPSLCEGFGLPALEAMASGAPVIGSNNTSIPEVIGYADALFDAKSPQSIANKMHHFLTDDIARTELRVHGLKQAKQFAWDAIARKTLAILEQLKSTAPVTIAPTHPLKLAFVAPFPPERTGIADYSAELLEVLSQHYKIDVILHQAHAEIPAKFTKRCLKTFEKLASTYDRIIYQFGNSPYHTHMLNLLERYPGVVVMHDFYLSGLLAYEEMSEYHPGIWLQAVLHSHGYTGLQQHLTALSQGTEAAKNTLPCNLEVLQNAKGIIVHSEHAKTLAQTWYGELDERDWHLIPLLRQPGISRDKVEARKQLQIPEHAFVVCSFGLIDPTKLTHRLLTAWRASKLHQQSDCYLILVGTNHGGAYGQDIVHLSSDPIHSRIRITGFAEKNTYQAYLAAADVGVQLRTNSRGETSAAVLDCMNYGLATIANAHGSMAELPHDSVYFLPDEFEEVELVQALEELWQHPETRRSLATRAATHIHTEHHPVRCALRYQQAIEAIYTHTQFDASALVKAISTINKKSFVPDDLKRIAQVCAFNYKPRFTPKQLLIDVSAIARNDLKSGIERVVRAQLLALIKNPPKGFRVEPIYLSREGDTWDYRYAKQFTLKLFNAPVSIHLQDAPIDLASGDIFYAPDYMPLHMIPAAQAGLYRLWRALGISLNVLVYDLLPITMPHYFPKDAGTLHTQYLSEMACFADRIIGISQTVKTELQTWLKQQKHLNLRSLKVYAAPLGSDIAASSPSVGLPDDAEELLRIFKQSPTFLMVGTLEPRKGHLQTIAAFDLLWQEQRNVNLVIIGKEGWKALPDKLRRSIPTLIRKLQQHPELHQHLFWLPEVSDEYLEKIYVASTCYLAASEGEGFGLPLIEAGRFGKPIIARDIPIFREVAKEQAFYFKGLADRDLYFALRTWLDQEHSVVITTLPCISWDDNANVIKEILLDPPQPARQILIDVSSIVLHDLKSGIERVVRSQIIALTQNPPAGFRIEPIYLNREGNTLVYYYAKQYLSTLLGTAEISPENDTPITLAAGDIFYALDYAPYDIIAAANAGIFQQWRALGVSMNVLVYDLLPILMPHCFPEKRDSLHIQWLLESVRFADRLIGISHAVVADLKAWLTSQKHLDLSRLELIAAPLGADIAASAPTAGLPTTAETILRQLKASPSFLMVGTLEPRKGHLQTLAAFDLLWKNQHNVNLVIIGQEGWLSLPDEHRRTIPLLVQQLQNHPELNRRLVWLQDVSDEFLEKIYASCACYLATSEGEGFGLPLIEAARFGLPIIARDLPVFREVVNFDATYFQGLDATDLQSTISSWLTIDNTKSGAKTPNVLTWEENATLLKHILLGKHKQQSNATQGEEEIA